MGLEKLTKKQLIAKFETLKEAKQELEDELADVYDRVTDKDFYQGLAWGAGITAAIAIILVVVL